MEFGNWVELKPRGWAYPNKRIGPREILKVKCFSKYLKLYSDHRVQYEYGELACLYHILVTVVHACLYNFVYIHY